MLKELALFLLLTSITFAVALQVRGVSIVDLLTPYVANGQTVLNAIMNFFKTNPLATTLTAIGVPTLVGLISKFRQAVTVKNQLQNQVQNLQSNVNFQSSINTKLNEVNEKQKLQIAELQKTSPELEQLRKHLSTAQKSLSTKDNDLKKAQTLISYLEQRLEKYEGKEIIKYK